MTDIILTGGGTAGHITPNLALIPKLEALGYSIAYVGQKDSIEANLISKTDLPFFSIQAGKLRRYFDLENLTDLFKIALGLIQALLIILKSRPRLIFSKGGFVSSPVVWAAWLCRVPVIIHESDMTPGLANKLSIPFAKKVCFNFPETEKHLPEAKRCFTGLPIRENLLNGDSHRGKTFCNFSDDKPVILVMGGSQGAASINQAVRRQLDKLLLQFNICHLCGKNGLDATLEHKAGYRQFSYIDEELADILALSDLVVSRAGATSIFEFLALGLPSILIPLPLAASRGDQILNAASFEKQGYASVLSEEQVLSDPDSLYQAITLAHEKAPLTKETLRTASHNGTDKVIELIRNLLDAS